MHWRGTPGAGRGTPVLKSRGDSQAFTWAWHARSWAWHAGTDLQRTTMKAIEGAWHDRRGTPSIRKPQTNECATWKAWRGTLVQDSSEGVARQCTRSQSKGLGVPLGIEGMVRQLKNLTMACHLNAGRGTPATGTKAK
ncbi:hypothetical protein AHAS_Ahas16G0216400 [Arachis hypogaea]